jgi:hypothetical protein
VNGLVGTHALSKAEVGILNPLPEFGKLGVLRQLGLYALPVGAKIAPPESPVELLSGGQQQPDGLP